MILMGYNVFVCVCLFVHVSVCMYALAHACRHVFELRS